MGFSERLGKREELGFRSSREKGSEKEERETIGWLWGLAPLDVSGGDEGSGGASRSSMLPQ